MTISHETRTVNVGESCRLSRPIKVNQRSDSPLRPEPELPSGPSADGGDNSAEVRPAARPDPRLDYRDYCRPKLANLLAATGLNVPYRAPREASSLIDATGEAVTDFVGGFGAALLGHNPPELKQLAVELLESDIPAHTQGSNREAAGALAGRLSGMMPETRAMSRISLTPAPKQSRRRSSTPTRFI